MEILVTIFIAIILGLFFYYLIDLFTERNSEENLENENCKGLGEEIVMTLRDPIKELVRYETEEGFVLPNDFKTDPAAWLEVLRSIEYAFDELYKEYSGELIAETSQEKTKEREVEISKGLELFGKYLRDLN